MNDYGTLKALLPARRTYYGQYFLLCLVKLAVLLLVLNALLRLIAAAAFSLSPLLWAAINLAAIFLAAVYFFLNRPDELQFARWLDAKIGSKERLQTLYELALSSSSKRTGSEKTVRRKMDKQSVAAGPSYQVQTSPEMRALIIEETGRYLQAHPPAVTYDRRLFRYWLPALLLALAVCAGVLFISPALSEWVSGRQELKIAREEASQALATLEELLAGEPLLEELAAELALVKEQLAANKSPDEVALTLQETRELLAEYAEKLVGAREAYQIVEELLAAKNTAEITSALQKDSQFNRQLLTGLQGLQNRLFQLNFAGMFELEGEISRLAEALEGKTEITPKNIQELQGLLEQMDPDSARAALQSGLNQLGSGSTAGKGGPKGNAVGTGEDTGKTGGHQQGEGAGQGSGGSGEGNDSPDGGPGQSGSGTSGGGSGQQGSGPGNSGNGGTGDEGGRGGGAGTGSGALAEQQFDFIPGDQQVELGGNGEEGTYTWQEILKYNPELLPENLTPYYESYYHQGITSINRGQVPQPLENYLRAYFQAITPP